MNRAFCLGLVAAAALLAGACGGTPAAVSPTTPPSALPHQMKGYELYSWQSGDAWNFTLITGTDRLKTSAEITAGSASVSGDGPICVTAQGVDGVKRQLARLPANESIGWISTRGEWHGGLPPASIVDDVKRYCQSRGLNLLVAP